MRFSLIIATLLLFAVYSNLIQLSNLTEVASFMLSDESEPEEENKSEKDFKKYKFDKQHYYFDYSPLLSLITEQGKSLQRSGLCLKGHCALIDQPPEA
jgi:hypothetical protein